MEGAFPNGCCSLLPMFVGKADLGGRLALPMEWNVPGKYGPHGVLLFFLIQKKSAIVPNSEAFNSFIGDGFQVPEFEGRR